MTLRRVVPLGTFVLCAFSGLHCGGSSSPTQPTQQGVQVIVGFFGAPFTATVEGRTISADGQFTFTMTPGTHEISGTFTSGLMVVSFGGGSLGGGGVQSGSLVSLD